MKTADVTSSSHPAPSSDCILLSFFELCILPESPAAEILSWVAGQPADQLSLGQVFTGLTELCPVEECGKVLSR